MFASFEMKIKIIHSYSLFFRMQSFDQKSDTIGNQPSDADVTEQFCLFKLT